MPQWDGCAEALARVHHLLLEAEFSQGAVGRLLGPFDADTPQEDLAPQWEWLTRGTDPLSILVRLFVLQRPVSVAAARRGLRGTWLEDWHALGLLRPSSDRVFPCVKLAPCPGFIVASDLDPRREPAADHVLGITTSAIVLSRLIISNDVHHSLDLGAGSGYLALHTAAHSESALGVDVNHRAVAFARFNAALNSTWNADFTWSDLFSALGGKRFDLIVGNLPFVISPENRLLFRDGGGGGDGFFESVIREAPSFLEEGGYAQFLGQWCCAAGEDTPGRIADWLRDSACDAWILRFAKEPVHAYATRWIAPGGAPGAGRRRKRYRAWMSHYEELGIEAVSTGLWTLRRRRGSCNWLRIGDSPLPTVFWGDDIQRRFEAEDFLEAHAEPEALLGARVRLSPFLALSEGSHEDTGGWSVKERALKLRHGFGGVELLDSATAQWLPLCAEARELRRVWDRIRRDDILAEEQRARWLDQVRDFTLRGFLTPAGA